MGRSAEAAAETRKSIVTAAAAEFRERGFDKVGLADLMSQLGLTHGGFYRHFENKDQLIAEACEQAFELINYPWPKNAKEHSKEGLSYFVSRYLSPKYRDNPCESCAFAMLGSDIARSDETTRSVATKAFQNLVDVIEKALPAGDQELRHREASLVACSLIGTLTVARFLSDKKLSNSVMNSMKEHILSSFDDQYSENAQSDASSAY